MNKFRCQNVTNYAILFFLIVNKPNKHKRGRNLCTRFILACQASQVFYLNDTKLGNSWQVVQHMTHRNMYDIPTGIEKVHEENEDNGDVVYQESECIGVNATVQQENDENSTLLHRDSVPAIDLGDLILLDDVYVQLDESMFINDDFSNEEWDTDSNNEEETYSHDDVLSLDQEKDLSSNDESIGDLRDED